jgi:hypothetical protein
MARWKKACGLVSEYEKLMANHLKIEDWDFILEEMENDPFYAKKC